MKKHLVSFFIQGEPRPKQSYRASKSGGYQPAAIKAWQSYVAMAAESAMREIGRYNQPFNTGVLRVQLDFYLGNNRRVDLDNLAKAVQDGMNKIVYGDDLQVVDLHLRKFVMDKRQDPGVWVYVGQASSLLHLPSLIRSIKRSIKK